MHYFEYIIRKENRYEMPVQASNKANCKEKHVN